ncbi:MAG: hypothetical protein NWR97_04155 [Salibacteraceae bacterium]|nr:hypothetical protein [Salibacteraceae bacterium]
MKSKHIILAALAFAATNTFTSCKKTEGCTDSIALNFNAEAEVEDGSCTYAELEDVSFSILAPTAGGMFGLNDTVKMKATITTTLSIHGYRVQLLNKTNDNEEVFLAEEHAHTSPLSINEVWINNVSSHSDMLFVVTVIVDHDETEIADTVSFHCHPM